MSFLARLLASLGLLLGALLCAGAGAGFYYLVGPCCGSPEPASETPLMVGGLAALICLVGSIAVWFQPPTRFDSKDGDRRIQ